MRSLALSLKSWRTAAVVLLSFSSGLPLGLVWIAIPDWMRSSGVDIKTVGLMTLAQAPWTFKFLWSPLMDRWAPPFGGRRRGWMLITQALLLVFTAALAGVGVSPDLPWIVASVSLAIAFASASQDIAIDAYAVDVLRPEEQGVAVGARIAVYRAGMSLAGGIAITLAARVGWPFVTVLLAALYLPMMLVAWRAPEPEQKVVAPRTLRDAVWLPFLGFLSRHRALEILAFVLTYKLSENLGLALLRPFLVDMGYSADDRGIALTVVSTTGVLFDAFLGGALTNVMGLGRALWSFGALQIVSNVGYVLIANGGGSRPLMYGAMGFESLTQGLGTGAFSVLLLRLTQKRFSATQYALFSSLFGIPRLVAGPISGFVVDAIGWKAFFWSSMLAGIPGLLLLARFVPLGVREPVFEVEHRQPLPPLGRGALVVRGALGCLGGVAFGALSQASLQALRVMRGHPEVGFDVAAQLRTMLAPVTIADWLGLVGLLALGAICGLLTAAVAAARHGEGRELAV
jgi:PAT family beta-lactamase induction signal transducer AmpG